MATPLFKKLGIKSGNRHCLINNPAGYLDWLETDATDIEITSAHQMDLDFVHIFATEEEDLITQIQTVLPGLKKDGMIWISWPKKSSSIPSSIDKWDVMRIGQESGLVDVKVCAVNDDWSAHKFVFRLKDR